MIPFYNEGIGHNLFQRPHIAHLLGLNLHYLIMTPQAPRIMFRKINLHLATGMKHLGLD